MDRILLLAILWLFLVLTGCESVLWTEAEGEAYRAHLQAQKAREEAQRRENYFAGLRVRCQNYGFQNGTTEMANCVQQLDMQKREEQQRRGHCNLARAQALNEPTRSGLTGESFAKENEAFSRCMSGR